MNEKMKKVDLHLHSTHSDGSDDLKGLMEKINEADVEIVSFTDHDNVDIYSELDHESYKRLGIITGVELTFVHRGEVRDMLAYGIDVPLMKSFLDVNYGKESSMLKQQLLLDKFKEVCIRKNLKFDPQVTVNKGTKSEAFGVLYTELAAYESNMDKCPALWDMKSFYRNHYANPVSEFYVDESYGYPGLEDVMVTIRKSSGLAVLAHPLIYPVNEERFCDLIDAGLDAGIDGIEVYHSQHSSSDIASLDRIARSNDLCITGGSDYHGAYKPDISVGTGRSNLNIQKKHIEKLLSRIM